MSGRTRRHYQTAFNLAMAGGILITFCYSCARGHSLKVLTEENRLRGICERIVFDQLDFKSARNALIKNGLRVDTPSSPNAEELSAQTFVSDGLPDSFGSVNVGAVIRFRENRATTFFIFTSGLAL